AQEHQRKAVEKFGLPLEVQIPDIGIRFRLIPPGEFTMGSADNAKIANDEEKPAHQVTIVHPYYMGIFPVTQGQWTQVMGGNPAEFQKAGKIDLPVECVSWDDCVKFLDYLGERIGVESGLIHLPSEAQWEYACRGGTEAARYGRRDAIAWHTGNSEFTTHPAGAKKPNAWGLYDMSGNIWEWCEDKWHDNYEGAPPDGSDWVDAGGSNRVCRGGDWTSGPWGCRSAVRRSHLPDWQYDDLGFRVVLPPVHSTSESGG
ncbi:MAG: formylglycine-generating enzyme family protein, partial [Planctomycetes bacterium]|nr:formylglycine-generating enzyme family protein [Planctomycetota bacterium]